LKLSNILKLIDYIHRKIGCSTPYICGGLPRDKIIKGNLKTVSDIDITTGDDTVKYLADEVYLALKRKFNVFKKEHKDGHISLFFKNIKLDFSSNFNEPDIEDVLKSKGINPTRLQKETWSRDFTCNALLINMDLKKILDLTNKGIQDISNKYFSVKNNSSNNSEKAGSSIIFKDNCKHMLIINMVHIIYY
jgi:tRNA nucleotidyltransferase/poly(A) polymerase